MQTSRPLISCLKSEHRAGEEEGPPAGTDDVAVSDVTGIDGVTVGGTGREPHPATAINDETMKPPMSKRLTTDSPIRIVVEPRLATTRRRRKGAAWTKRTTGRSIITRFMRLGRDIERR